MVAKHPIKSNKVLLALKRAPLLFVLYLCFFLQSCFEPKVTYESEMFDNATRIMIDPEANDFNLISEIATDIELIPIHTDINNLIGVVSKIIIVNDLYYILDKGPIHAIYCVDNSGNILFKIQDVGEGPGQYLSINSFSTDPENGHLTIYSPSQYKKLKYNLKTGDFIEEIFLNDIFAFDLHQADAFTYWYNDAIAGFHEYNLLITNREDEIVLSKHIKYEGEKDVIGKASNFFNYGDTISFYYGLNNIIYSINNDSFAPRFYIDFGKYNIPEEDKEGNLRELFEKMKSTPNRAGFISNFCEFDDLVFFTYSYDFNQQFVLYNKNSKKAYNVKEISNDINLVYFPPPVVQGPLPISMNQKGDLITILYPEQIKKMIQSVDQHTDALSRLNHTLLDVEESDNPIIMKVVLRDFL